MGCHINSLCRTVGICTVMQIIPKLVENRVSTLLIYYLWLDSVDVAKDFIDVNSERKRMLLVINLRWF